MHITTVAYDPLLDPSCTVLPAPTYPEWRGSWLWYPSQLTTHLHTKAMQATVARCSSVSYPGSFHQPVYQLYVRHETHITRDQELRWQTTPGRSRVFINGRAFDFTRRSWQLTPGPLSLLWILDFCTSLPCIIVDAEEVTSDATWQVSLDGVHWVAAETRPDYTQPALLPDAAREVTVHIPVQEVVQGTVASDGAMHLTPDGDVVLDFGHIELATIRLTCSGVSTVHAVVGESLLEVLSDDVCTFEQHPLDPIQSRVTPAEYTWPERCVRFVRLHAQAPCVIHDVALHARVAPVTYRGEFACDDAEVQAIWQAGAATLHACLHDFYLDGLRRDGLPWADQLSEVEGADCVFFDTQAARHSLISLTFPDSPRAADFGIIDQPLYQPMSFWHDWMMRGDVAFVRQYQARWQGLLDLYISLQDAQGLISAARVYAEAPQRDANWNFFPDWAMTPDLGPDTRGTPTYMHMQLMRCFEIGAELSHQLGDTAHAERYVSQAQQLRQTILDLFWDAERALFINGIDQHGQRDERVSSHAQVWGILCDLVPTHQAAQLVTTVLENPHYRAPNISLNHHWELHAYAKAGVVDRGLAVLKRVWGGWLAQGHRRFPEDFRYGATVAEQLSMYGRPFANSLCHGWSGGAAVAFLMHDVLGITATAPGFTACRVAPQLGHLQWVRGFVPTPHGEIALEWDGAQGVLSLPALTAELVDCQSDAGQTTIHGPGEFALRAL